jgi:uncharacterized protein YecT (DUF1311 family)
MFRLLCAAAFAAATFTVAEAGSPECRNPMDQHTMNLCAGEEFDAADKELNEVYTRLLAAMDDEGYRAKLKVAQRNWIQFRDNECTFETADNEGGSIHPMVYTGCLTRLTRERTRALQAHLTCWQNADRCEL